MAKCKKSSIKARIDSQSNKILALCCVARAQHPNRLDIQVKSLSFSFL